MDGRALRSLLCIRQYWETHCRSEERELPGEQMVTGLRVIRAFQRADDIPALLEGSFASRGTIPTKHALFFDTETNGLAGGIGTRVFMIGTSEWGDG